MASLLDLKCPRCGAEWWRGSPSVGARPRIPADTPGGIVEATCDCYYAIGEDEQFIYNRFMRATGKKNARGLAACVRLETPFGVVVCQSVHPCGIGVSSEEGFSRFEPLTSFDWHLTKDWELLEPR